MNGVARVPFIQRRASMSNVSAGQEKDLVKIVTIDEGQIQAQLDTVVLGTVEETLNTLLEAEADRLCQATR
jgi:ACT domain-containing protein